MAAIALQQAMEEFEFCKVLIHPLCPSNPHLGHFNPHLHSNINNTDSNESDDGGGYDLSRRNNNNSSKGYNQKDEDEDVDVQREYARTLSGDCPSTVSPESVSRLLDKHWILSMALHGPS